VSVFTAALAAVIGLEIIRDDLGVAVGDRRAEHLDHLGDFRIPQCCIGKRRVHLDVIKAVARAAIPLDLLQSRRFFQIDHRLQNK